MPRIVIIGKGNIGNAIADILRPKKIDIAFWDTAPGKSADKRTLARQNFSEKPLRSFAGQNLGKKNLGGLAEIIPSADFVFLCVPSFAVPQAVFEIKPYLSRRTIIVSIAKGIEKKSGATMDELLHRLIPFFPFALLSGPMLARELSESMGGAAVVASKDVKTRNAVAHLFENTELRVAASRDVRGVALAGVLKNVYAIVLGAADGIGNGCNAKGFLFGTAQSEMADILPLLGGMRETAGIPALVGDLFATGMSSASNNYTFGAALFSAARNRKIPLFTEGMVAAPFIAKRLGARVRRFPLFEIAVALVKQPKEGKKKLEIFLLGTRKR